MNASLRSAPPIQVPTSSRSVLWPYVLSIAIWGLDYKAASRGAAAAFQAVLLAVCICCFAWIMISASRRGIRAGALWVLILATFGFMIESSTVGLIRGQPAYSIAVNLIPVFLYVSASVITYLTFSIAKDQTPLFVDGLRVACIASVLGHLLVVYLSSGIDLATSRYEVLSGAVIPCLAVIGVGLATRLSKLDMLLVLLNLSVALLSVTRTLVIVLGVQVAMVIIARPSIILMRSARKGIGLLTLIAIAVVALDFVAGTGLTARWTERLFLSNKLGTDPSGLLRIAETHFMWDRFTSSLQTVVFGNGLAAVTSAIGREDVLVAMLVGRKSAVIHMTGIGHENYVSILYVAGLLGGGGLVILQFLNGFQSLALIRKFLRRPADFMDADAHMGIWGALIVGGMLTTGFLSGTFEDRGGCVWFGVGTGMLYWARQLVSRNIGQSGAKS